MISVTRQKKRLIRSVHIRHFRSNEEVSTPEHPIFVLDNKEKEHAHHSAGFFTNPTKRTAFEFKEEDSKESYTADILKVDSRFVSLVRWLGDNHINVRLSGEIQQKDMQFIRFVRSHLAAVQSFQQRMVSYSL